MFEFGLFSYAGSAARVAYFNDDVIVSGDMVKVELDPEVFKAIHQANQLWGDSLIQVLSLCIHVPCPFYTYCETKLIIEAFDTTFSLVLSMHARGLW